MAIEESLVSRLTSDAPLVALIGTRISPLIARQGNALPLVTYERILTQPNQTMGLSSGYFVTRFSFSCWAKDDATARQIASAIRASLDGFSGTILGKQIWGIIHIDEFALYDEDAKLFEQVIEFRILHN